MQRELKHRIDGILEFKDKSAFRQYRIAILNKWGEYVQVYQNKRATIKELKLYKKSHYYRFD